MIRTFRNGKAVTPNTTREQAVRGIPQRRDGPWRPTHDGTMMYFAKMQSVCVLVPLIVVGLAVSCATVIHPPREFLSSTDNSWNQWLDTAVDVDLADVRIIHLPLTDAFSGLRIAIARVDAPVESLKVTLHASQITRRQALWLLCQKYDLAMAIQELPGKPPYVAISKE
jgi:hypothetical protein